MPRTLTPSECIMRAHRVTGYENEKGERIVQNVYSFEGGKIGVEWETLPPVPDDLVGDLDEDPLMEWLGY